MATLSKVHQRLSNDHSRRRGRNNGEWRVQSVERLGSDLLLTQLWGDIDHQVDDDVSDRSFQEDAHSQTSTMVTAKNLASGLAANVPCDRRPLIKLQRRRDPI
jgi:hypothetical protein